MTKKKKENHLKKGRKECKILLLLNRKWETKMDNILKKWRKKKQNKI